MSQKKLETKLILYSSSSRQRNTTVSPTLEKNKKIGDYLLLSTIGRGTFSKVKLGIHIPTKQKVAIKILDKEKINDEADIERIRREIHILSILRHPNIVQLYETITCSNNIYIIMEYVEGKDLFQYIYSMQRLSEYKSSQLFRQLISCLEYIHKIGIVHRDIKPENILLNKSKKKLKLVDFGLSNVYEKDELIKTACGSPCYAAPEMISGKNYEGFYSDLWSCGVVLYCMLVGKLPFDDEDIKKLYHNIKLANYEMPNFLSYYAQDILSKILVSNPKRRIKLNELKRHPFLLLSEKTPMYKGIIVDSEEIQVDYDIVQKMKEKYFNDDENCNINSDIIVENVKNNLHNKITTIYNLLYKLKCDKILDNDYIYNKKSDKNFINDNNNNDIEEHKNNKNSNKEEYVLLNNEKNDDSNKETDNEKSPSFAKIRDKIEKNIIIDSGHDENHEINQSINKTDINDNNNSTNKNNNEKRYNIYNIKKLLFNNPIKKAEINNNNNIDKNDLKDSKSENITINNDNNEKRFNILVINNFMSDKESSYKNNSSLENKINVNNHIKNIKIDKRINKKLKINIRRKNENDKNKSFITENNNNSKCKKIEKNKIMNNITKNNKNISKDVKRLHSINYCQKKGDKTSTDNSQNSINFTVSINHTNKSINKNNTKNINYNNLNNTNKICYNNIKRNNYIDNNNYKNTGINGINLKSFQKCKKINFESLGYDNTKINDNYNLNNNINVIKNENMHRHNYIISKINMNKDKKLNKSISFGKYQKNTSNKFKKYIKRLFEEDIYSINNDHSKNKSLNVTPFFNTEMANKNDKLFKNLSTNNSNNNKKILFINIDSDLGKLNKTTNLFEFSKTNELKKKQNLFNTNKNKIINNNTSYHNNKNIKNNINININTIKKNNLNKNAWEEKMIKYMKQRFKNSVKKKNTKDKSNNLFLKISTKDNNLEKKSKSTAKSPNSVVSKGKNETYSNKSYLKSNNKIFINKDNYNNNINNINNIYNIKCKFSNNSTKNNSLNKNKKIAENNLNNLKIKKNKNFLFAADFSNVIKKSISRNKKIKKKYINLTNYNYFLNNDLIHNIKKDLHNSYSSQEKKNIILNKEYKTSYHSKDTKSKFVYDRMKYSPLNNNKKILPKKKLSVNKKKNTSLNTNLSEFNLVNNSKEKYYNLYNHKIKK